MICVRILVNPPDCGGSKIFKKKKKKKEKDSCVVEGEGRMMVV